GAAARDLGAGDRARRRDAARQPANRMDSLHLRHDRHPPDGRAHPPPPPPRPSAGIKPRAHRGGRIVWATFYDIRRYGGLQILLRAVLDGGSLVLADAQEPIADHLARLGAQGATHVTGTPSHWRRVLMSPAAHAMAPGYVRLSGEIAAQAVLDNLHALYPQARIVSAFASTEAGVGFEVADAREGVPASTIEDPGNGAKLKVADGSLRISSPG